MIFYGWKDQHLHLLSIKSDKYRNYHSRLKHMAFYTEE